MRSLLVPEQLAAIPGGGEETELFYSSRGHDWRQLYVICGGKLDVNNSRIAPVTSSVFVDLPLIGDPFSFVSLSVLMPGTRVVPHCGQTNMRLTCHLPLQVPEGSVGEVGISVAGETRSWTEGEWLCFDDSFEHTVWNLTPEPRAVVVVKFRHPDLWDWPALLKRLQHLHVQEHTPTVPSDLFDVGEADDMLSALLALPATDFWANIWERMPLHVHGRAPGFFRSILSLHELDDLLGCARSVYAEKSQPPRNHRDISLVKLVVLPDGEPYTGKWGKNDTRLTVGIIKEAFNRGYSLLVNEMQQRAGRILQLCDGLERASRHPCNANLYLTPSSGRGFETHMDWMDSFVLQLSGSKRWNSSIIIITYFTVWSFIVLRGLHTMLSLM